MSLRKLFKFGLPPLAFLALIAVLSTGLLGMAFAAWTDTISFSGTVTTAGRDLGGTPGFWKNWDSHTKFTLTQVQAFLYSINAGSVWLLADMNHDGRLDITDMEMVFDAGERSGTMEQKFLRSYLATCLNAESGRLLGGPIRDFREYDPENYLELGGLGTLGQVITAIESRYGTSPTEEQFELMKDICDGLNNVEITLDLGWGPPDEGKPEKSPQPAAGK